jgi:tetratricopeptide (TPR) repeat protein
VRYQEAVLHVGAMGNLDKEKADLVAEYDKLVADRPNDLAARLHRMRLDEPAARIAALSKMAAATPSPLIQLEIGRAQLTAENCPLARKALEAALPQAPDKVEALLIYAESLRLSGDEPGARGRLEGALKEKADLFDVVLALGRMDLLANKPEDALTRANAVLGMRPSYLAAMLMKAEASARAKKIEDALTTLEAATRVNPDNPEARIAWADLVAKAGTPEALKRAVEGYEKAVASGGGFRAQYGLGWAQERLSKLPEAEKAYREAALLAPADAAAVNSIGYVLLLQKKFADAKQKFERAIDLSPDSPEPYANLGAVYEAQSDWNQAIKAYQRLFKIKGQEKNVRALLNCAFDYEALTTYAKAEELLEKVRAIKPDDAEVATFLGDNLCFQHKWKTAIKAYQDAIRLDAKNRFAWRGMGLALAEDDKTEDAVSALEKAKSMKSDDPPVLLKLGDLYADKLDNLEKALENYEAYVKAGGPDPDVPRIVEEIKKEIEAKKGK